jgi:hypothetical protein
MRLIALLAFTAVLQASPISTVAVTGGGQFVDDLFDPITWWSGSFMGEGVSVQVSNIDAVWSPGGMYAPGIYPARSTGSAWVFGQAFAWGEFQFYLNGVTGEGSITAGGQTVGITGIASVTREQCYREGAFNDCEGDFSVGDPPPFGSPAVVTASPEPGTLVMIALGVAFVIVVRRWRACLRRMDS